MSAIIGNRGGTGKKPSLKTLPTAPHGDKPKNGTQGEGGSEGRSNDVKCRAEPKRRIAMLAPGGRKKRKEGRNTKESEGREHFARGGDEGLGKIGTGNEEDPEGTHRHQHSLVRGVGVAH